MISFKLPDSLVDQIIDAALETPYQHLEGYMFRYWIKKSDATKSHGVRVHQILRSDHDQHFHSHPWPYCTLILRGAYTEITPYYVDGKYVGEMSMYYPTGSLLVRGPEHFHRLHLDPGTSAWTLFAFGERTPNDWGFLIDPEQRVVQHWRDYLGNPNSPYGVDGTSFKEHKA